MIYFDRYIIKQTPSFEKELEYIYNYISFNFNATHTANNFYKNVINQIRSLQYFPERYMKLTNSSRNLRKLPINNYVIIYEVTNDTRSNFYFTYFS